MHRGRRPVHTDHTRHHNIWLPFLLSSSQRIRRKDGTGRNHKDRTYHRPLRTECKQSTRRVHRQLVRTDRSRRCNESPFLLSGSQRIRRKVGRADIPNRSMMRRDRKPLRMVGRQSARRVDMQSAHTVGKPQVRKDYNHSRRQKAVRKCLHPL